MDYPCEDAEDVVMDDLPMQPSQFVQSVDVLGCRGESFDSLPYFA